VRFSIKPSIGTHYHRRSDQLALYTARTYSARNRNVLETDSRWSVLSKSVRVFISSIYTVNRRLLVHWILSCRAFMNISIFIKKEKTERNWLTRCNLRHFHSRKRESFGIARVSITSSAHVSIAWLHLGLNGLTNSNARNLWFPSETIRQLLLRNADYLIEPLQAGNIGIAARAWNIYHLLKNLLSSLEQLYGTSRKNAGSDIDIVEFTRKNISSLADK